MTNRWQGLLRKRNLLLGLLGVLLVTSGAAFRSVEAAHLQTPVKHVRHSTHLTRIFYRSQVASPPAIKAVSAQELAKEQGITLLAPGPTTVIMQAEAEKAALASPFEEPGATVLEAVLAQVHSSNVPRLDNRLFWVVSMRPAGGMSNSDGNILRMAYDLVFVDAVNGQPVARVGRGAATPQR